MSIRFYTDTHIPKQVAIQLREKGVDVIRCEDVGLAEADDEEHLEYAAEHGLALITKDFGFRSRHFRWMEESKKHSGIFYCNDRNNSAIGKIVKECLLYVELIDEEAGTLVDIENQFFEIF